MNTENYNSTLQYVDSCITEIEESLNKIKRLRNVMEENKNVAYIHCIISEVNSINNKCSASPLIAVLMDSNS